MVMLVLLCSLAALLRRPALRSAAVLVVCVGFWLYVDARALPLYLAMAAVSYAAPLAVRRVTQSSMRKAAFVCLIALLLAPLIWYRYVSPAMAEGASAAALMWVPLGISYTTFRLLAYMVDNARYPGAPVSPLRHALYTLFFPFASSGPIERWSTFAEQDGAAPRAYELGLGLHRIITGLFKKVVLSDAVLFRVINWASGGDGPYGLLPAWVLFIAYPQRLYLDFSGYTDIAIGTARLCGYRLTENFDRPFLATSPIDFWRRWHITLSQWIQAYLFMPVAKHWRSRLGKYAGVWVSMVLCGVWHGSAAQYVLWGVLQAAGVSAAHLWGDYIRRRGNPLRRVGPQPLRVLSISCTYVFTSLGFVLFTAGPDGLLRVIEGMLGLG